MKVESSHISEVVWTESGDYGYLDVTFKTGATYRYFDVPKGIYEKLLTAQSKGSYLEWYVKRAGYRYQKIS